MRTVRVTDDELAVIEVSRRLRARSAEAYEDFLKGGVMRLMAADLQAEIRGEITPRFHDLTLDSDSVAD